VERVLEQRAVSVNLHPEIEDSCRDFLIQNCAHATGNGEEIKCLQVTLRPFIEFQGSML
jgi:Golgi apparatus protein 1